MNSVGIKIRCASDMEAAIVQILLRDTIGAGWGTRGANIPWSTFRRWLVVGWSAHLASWVICWAPEREFDAIPYPEWSASALLAAAPKAKSRSGWQIYPSEFFDGIPTQWIVGRGGFNRMQWLLWKGDPYRMRRFHSHETAQAAADRLNRKGIQ